jgi:hypothetical protein
VLQLFETLEQRSINQSFQRAQIAQQHRGGVGLRLPKGFKIPHSAQFDFEFEKLQLLKILDAAWQTRSAADWGPHPMFGTMTVKEWGKLLQIHIDYHLRQFAA